MFRVCTYCILKNICVFKKEPLLQLVIIFVTYRVIKYRKHGYGKFTFFTETLSWHNTVIMILSKDKRS